MPDEANPHPVDEQDVATPVRGVPVAQPRAADEAAPAPATVEQPAVPSAAPVPSAAVPVFSAPADVPPAPPAERWPAPESVGVTPLPAQVATLAPAPAFDPSRLLTPVLAALGAYGAALVVSLAAVAFILFAASGDSRGSGSDDVSSADAASTVGVLVRLPFLLASAGLLGQVTASVDTAIGGAGASLFLVPLTITAAAVGGAWLVTALRAPVESVRRRWTDALLTGAVLGLVGALCAAVTGVEWSFSNALLDAGARLGANALGTFVGGFVVGVVGSALGHAFGRRAGDGRVGLSRLGIAVPVPFVRSGRALSFGAVPVVLVGTCVGVLVALVKLGFAQTVALVLTVLPTVVVYAFTLGGFGALEGGSGSGDGDYATLFSGQSGWLWLLVLLPVLTVLLAGIVRYLDGVRREWSDAGYTVGLVAAIAVVALLVTQVNVNVGGFGLLGSNASVWVRMAWWVVPLAAVWGLLVEVVARLLAPSVVVTVPAVARWYARMAHVLPSANGAAAGARAGEGRWPGADGAAVPGAPAGAGAAAGTGAAARPIDKRRARIVLGVGAGVVVLVVGAAVGRAIVNDAYFSPSKPVEAYVDQLAGGDVDGAFALADADVPSADRELLTNDVYGKVDGRPSGSRVTKTRVDGDAATVTVTSKQGGRTVTQDFDVVKNGRTALFFDKWEMAPVEVPTADAGTLLPWDSESFTVNGHTLEGNGAFRALPGTYTIGLPIDADRAGLVEAGEASVVVYPDGTSEASTQEPLALALTAAAKDDMAQDAAAFVSTTCLGQAVLEVDECGLHVWEWREDEAKNITWTAKAAPTVEASLTDDGTIAAHVTGEATVAYRLPKADYLPAESPTEDDTYDFWITYDAQGGKLVRTGTSDYLW